jgi:dihydropyrimidine dehydrogenase (NAD+) subunit PreA
MSKLSVKFSGLELKNPFFIGSGPMSTDLNSIDENRAEKVIKRVVESGWAGIALKTVVHYDALRRAGPYLWSPHNRTLPFSLQNLGPWETRISEEKLRKNTRIAKKAGLVVIGNILGTNEEEWGSLCRTVEDCGVDAVELNVSCPHAGHGLALIGQDPSLLEQTVKIAKKECSIPVIPKLPSIIHDISSVVEAAQAAGADGISAINTVPGLIGIDIESGIPIHRDISNNARYSGVSGSLIKPLGLGYVAQIAGTVQIPISGIGGIRVWKDAVEYIMAGATTVQLCTEVFMKGFDIGKKLVSGLEEFMDAKGYERIDELRGISLGYIKTEMGDMDTTSKVVSVIDPVLCTGCKSCVTACADAVVEAIHMNNDIAIVDENTCVGCGLCGVVCNVKAVSFTRVS